MIEKVIDGKTYGFHFNFFAWGIAEEETGLPMDDILKVIGPDTDENGVPIKKPKRSRIKIICSLLYAGAVNYCQVKSVDVTFKVNDMGEWMEEIGYNESMIILKGAIDILKPKNIQPPLKEGEQQQVGESQSI